MKVLIVEDEFAAAQRLSKMIGQLVPNYEIIGVLDSIEETINWYFNHTSPDLMFLDIQLSDGLSFEIFNHIDIDCPIIFTTAYDQYAIQAFSVHAVDYLLKPLKTNHLRRALDRAQSRLSQKNMKKLTHALPKVNPPKRVLVKVGNTIKVVEYNQAAYFYTKDKITFLQAFDDKRYPIDYSLEKLEEILDSSQFFRINRQFIINLKAISEMHSYSKSRIKINLKPVSTHETIVSTDRTANFKRWLVGH